MKAKLHISLITECPHCGTTMDLMEYGSGYNDECEMTQAACPDGVDWVDEHEKFEQDVKCRDCGETYTVKGIDW